MCVCVCVCVSIKYQDPYDPYKDSEPKENVDDTILPADPKQEILRLIIMRIIYLESILRT